ncbi:DUF4339 domain-containing protein [Solimonas sp. K1W22B-7]|uniref:DUF4339 domain-containing protein n=1 Tax=Solimonas sp. K1W22B-7 TaxID=2303331 RepID=UPI000E3373E7|nr:DUF4339 domain-containing protein [Solimonas sp. K1W22B-7]AXQ28234.1 DUF4339 domain-containing protein [Solimonas sp. K1W22B-7]
MQESQDSGARVWWYANGSEQHGPVSGPELKRIAAGGGLRQDALVWREGMAEWITAASVRGLLPAAATAPPPPPPPPVSPQREATPGTWAAPAPPGPASNEAPWFAVSTTKLLVMSFCTLTFYNLYWLYQNWLRIRQRDRSDISPVARTLFGIFFVHVLFRRVRDDAEAAGLSPSYSVALLTTLFIVMALTWRLPDPWDWISAMHVFVLLPVQALANRINAAVAPGHERNERYSGANIATIVIGGLLMVMAVLGSFIEEEPEEENSGQRRKPGRSAPVAMPHAIPSGDAQA